MQDTSRIARLLRLSSDAPRPLSLSVPQKVGLVSGLGISFGFGLLAYHDAMAMLPVALTVGAFGGTVLGGLLGRLRKYWEE